MKAWRSERLLIHLGGLSWLVILVIPILIGLFALDRMLLLPLQARFGLLALAVGVCVWKIYNLWFSRLQPYDGLVWASRVEQIFPGLNSLLVNYVNSSGLHQLRPVRRSCIEWSRPKPSMLLSL